MEGKRRQSFAGGAAIAHDESGAEKLLKAALSQLDLQPRSLKTMAKGADEKQVLAWLLRTRTAVSRRWVSERLGMGDESRVTQAVVAVRRARRGRLRKLKERIQFVDPRHEEPKEAGS
jgi:hypothetical protein